ncbi:MAG: AMP-binding protein [Candidatus Methanomethylophilaceae archaeon]|nr:AMP-binding protein [Candidatus Methanomethylophilaceae archaeon]
MEYPDCSMISLIEKRAQENPDLDAYIFFGKKTSYGRMMDDINQCAKGLKAIGVKKGDRVTVALPNCPQGVTIFYAINMIGAVASMIHPLSSEKEIEFFINDSKSVMAITLDQFYGKFDAIRKNVCIRNLVITSIKDVVSLPVKIGYNLTEGRKHDKVPKDADIILWKDLMGKGRTYVGEYRDENDAGDASVVLYSGGTTGLNKGILLSSYNFNALAMQTAGVNPNYKVGDRMLTVMPIFHGFGLGISVHTILVHGGCCILVPRFTPQSYAKLMMKYKCNYIAGVPALFEALIRMPKMENVDLSFLKGMFSGGDSLSIELKKKVDNYLYEHNSSIQVREGYGTTECVTASCLTPIHTAVEGSIGLPMPDMFYKIVEPGTENELPYGETGEICLAGPTVMLGYLDQPEETANTLRTHADGMTWVHTGDLGSMDDRGFVYFKQRLKRMIITNGYNVYPSQLENAFDAHEKVHMSCIIGVPDPIKKQKVKAFIMLKPGIKPSDDVKSELMEYAKKNISKYALPYDIEFREDLPKTLVGKVAYRKLEEEELSKLEEN